MTPTISVVLPVYNSEPYLGAAVESILSQSFRDFELIAVEGGSGDGSRATLEEFARRDARVRIVEQAGKGLVCALNQGVSLAQGEFLARMDADDISHPARFETQLAFLRSNPGIAVVGCALILIDGEGRRLRDIDYPEHPSDVARCLEVGSALAHPAVMMRSDAVRCMGGYREVLDFAEDFDLWLRMSERFLLANLPDRLLSYRHHASKRGCLFAFEQELHTQFARLSAAARRAGHADPLADVTAIGLADIERFALSAAERERVAFDLLGPLSGAAKPEELIRVAQVMRLLPTPPSDRARAARKSIELGILFLQRRDIASAVAWVFHAVRTDPREVAVMLASFGARGRRKLIVIGSRIFRFARL
jgi:glycosyltransferase involved in cell wall biosynthesis